MRGKLLKLLTMSAAAGTLMTLGSTASASAATIPPGFHYGHIVAEVCGGDYCLDDNIGFIYNGSEVAPWSGGSGCTAKGGFFDAANVTWCETESSTPVRELQFEEYAVNNQYFILPFDPFPESVTTYPYMRGFIGGNGQGHITQSGNPSINTSP